MAGPLDGIKVLDLSQYVAGPWCTKYFADFGAQVIKVERPPKGDPSRRAGPFLNDEPHPERSALFLHLNTNKRSITVNLKSDAGRQIALRLAAESDVVVENFRPGTMERLGLGFEELSKAKGDVILTSISDFGQTGPYRDLKGSEIVLYAMGGAMHMTGERSKEPLKLGGNIIQCHAGSVAFLATNLALTTVELGGKGQHIDVSIYETQAGSRDRRVIYLTTYAYTGEPMQRPETGTAFASGTFPCADGYVLIQGGGRRFPLMAEMIGQPELAQDERFATPMAQRNHDNVVTFNDEYLLPWLLERDKRTITAMAQKHKLLTAPIFTVEDLLQDPHYRDRGAFEVIDHPETGPLEYTGRPFIMSESPRPPARRAPLLGEHTEDVLCGELGYSAEDLAEMRRKGVV